MKKYKLDEKGRVRLSSNVLNYFSNSSTLGYSFDLINSTFVINNNLSLPHHY